MGRPRNSAQGETETVDSEKTEVTLSEGSDVTPEENVVLKPQYLPMENVRSELNDLEHELSKKVEELKQSGDLDQNLNEVIRLGAARHLQRAQAAMDDMHVKLDAWDVDYGVYLKERNGIWQAKDEVNNLSAKVEQERVTLYRLKGIPDLDFQRLVSLAMLPEARFKELLK